MNIAQLPNIPRMLSAWKIMVLAMQWNDVIIIYPMPNIIIINIIYNTYYKYNLLLVN